LHRLDGRVLREGDDPEKLHIEFDRLLAEQKTLQHQRPIEADTIDRCKRWLADLPAIPDTEVQIPAHRGQSLRRIADSNPVIADSCR
jgi:hypothetical protein